LKPERGTISFNFLGGNMTDGQAGQKRQRDGRALTAEQLEAGKKWLQLVAQARTDQTLKQRLMDTPVAVLQEHGIDVRKGLDIHVVEDTDKVVYLKLPTKAQLTDIDLDRIVGGGIVEAVAGGIVQTIAGVVNTVTSAGSAVVDAAVAIAIAREQGYGDPI
jgi:hypothetical protein